MKIILRDGNWYANGYVIVGYKEIGYEIYSEEDYAVGNPDEPIESYDDFENALTFVYNS